MLSCYKSASALVFLSLLCALTSAQTLIFTQYPTQVVNGLSYPVSWDAAGVSVTVNLLRGNALEETLYSGSGTSFTWNVEDDLDDGTDYALQLVSQGSPPTTLTSGSIWMIEDDDGLFVNGQQIYASVPNGPTPSGLSTVAVATATSVVSDANGQASTTLVTSTAPASSQIGLITETLIFTSAASMYTFTVTATSRHGPAPAAPLTFVSNGATFTTTIAGVGPTSPPEPGIGPGRDRGGLSGGAIAGIVIGILLALLLAGTAAFFWVQRRRRQRTSQPSPESPVAAFIRGGRRALSNRRSQHSATGTSDRTYEKEAPRDSVVSPLSPRAESEMEAMTNQVPVRYTSSIPSIDETLETDGHPRFEMDSAPPRYELAAADVQSQAQTQVPATCVALSEAGSQASPSSPNAGTGGSAPART